MRFYVHPDSIFLSENIINIKNKAEVHHIRDVMRLKKGDSVDIFDGQGSEFLCAIEEFKKDEVLIAIKGKLVSKRDKPYSVTLYQAIPKKSKMDFVIEKTVELGVDRIVPIMTERTIPEIKDPAGRIERWKRIGMASSKQCGRRTLPVVSDITDFDNALIDSKQKGLVVFASLDKESKSLNKILRETPVPKNIAVFVGPEGDFSPAEVSMAKGSGYSICSLGDMVLKSDTAAIYILSCLSYEFQSL